MSVALLSMLLLSACQDPSPPEPPARVAELHRALEAMHTCHGTAQCWTAGQLAP